MLISQRIIGKQHCVYSLKLEAKNGDESVLKIAQDNTNLSLSHVDCRLSVDLLILLCRQNLECILTERSYTLSFDGLRLCGSAAKVLPCETYLV